MTSQFRLRLLATSRRARRSAVEFAAVGVLDRLLITLARLLAGVIGGGGHCGFRV